MLSWIPSSKKTASRPWARIRGGYGFTNFVSKYTEGLRIQIIWKPSTSHEVPRPSETLGLDFPFIESKWSLFPLLLLCKLLLRKFWRNLLKLKRPLTLGRSFLWVGPHECLAEFACALRHVSVGASWLLVGGKLTFSWEPGGKLQTLKLDSKRMKWYLDNA